MKWLVRSIIIITTILAITLVLIFIPANQRWIFNKAKSYGPEYGIHIHSTPKKLNIFSGLEWEDLNITYRDKKSSEIKISAVKLSLEYELSYLPFHIRINNLSLVKPKISGELRLETSTNDPPPAPSRPLTETIKTINIEKVSISEGEATIQLHSGPKIDEYVLRNFNIDSSLQVKNDSLEILPFNFHVDRIKLAKQAEIEDLRFWSKKSFVVGCLSCKRVRLPESFAARLSIQRADLKGHHLKQLSLNGELRKGNELSINTQIRNLSSELLFGSRTMRLNSNIHFVAQDDGLKSTATLALNKEQLISLDTQVKNSGEISFKSLIDLSENSIASIPKAAPMQSLLKDMRVKLSGDIDSKQSTEHWSALDFSRFLESFLVQASSEIKLTPQPKGILQTQGFQLKMDSKISKLNIDELNVELEADRLHVKEYSARGLQLTASLFKNEDYVISTTARVVGGPLTAETPLALDASINKKFPQDLSSNITLGISGEKALEFAVSAQDEKNNLAGKIDLSIFTGENLASLLPSNALDSIGKRKVDLKADFVLHHNSRSLFEVSDYSKVDYQLTSRVESSDTSKNAISLPLNSILELQVKKSAALLNTNLKLDIPEINYGKFNTKDLRLVSLVNLDNSKIIVDKFNISAANQSLIFNLNGQYDGVNGQFDSLLRFDSLRKTQLVPNVQLKGSAGSNLKISVTEKSEIDINGKINTKEFNLYTKNFDATGINGIIPFSENFRIKHKDIIFDSLKVRNPFQRVDFRSIQPLLSDIDSGVEIKSIRLEDKTYGPLFAVAELEQNLLSMHRFNLAINQGRIDGEFHIDLLPKRFSLSLLSHFQEFKLGLNIPSQLSGGRGLSNDPINSRLGIVVDLNRSTVDGRIDVNDITAAQLHSALDLLDPEHENNQFVSIRKGLNLGAPQSTSLNLHEGLLDAEIELPVFGEISIKSLNVSGQIKKSFSAFTKLLQGVPIK